ncbi:MAG: hypothetical protein ABIK78_03365 [candidate division WOR-3 bacterium]
MMVFMLYKLIAITEIKWGARGLNKDIIGKLRVKYLWYYLVSKLKRIVYKYYLSFSCDYPKSIYKYYYIPGTFYIGYLNFLRKGYRLIKKRKLLNVESLLKKQEVLKEIKFLLLKVK